MKTNDTTTQTFTVEGMSCGHCEAAVKNALTALKGITACEASHSEGTVTVSYDASASLADITAAIEEEGYTVTGTR